MQLRERFANRSEFGDSVLQRKVPKYPVLPERSSEEDSFSVMNLSWVSFFQPAIDVVIESTDLKENRLVPERNPERDPLGESNFSDLVLFRRQPPHFEHRPCQPLQNGTQSMIR